MCHISSGTTVEPATAARPRGSLWRSVLVFATLAIAAPLWATLSGVPEPAIEWNPRSYVCLRAPEPVTVDGNIDEPVWSMAPSSPIAVAMTISVP